MRKNAGAEVEAPSCMRGETTTSFLAKIFDSTPDVEKLRSKGKTKELLKALQYPKDAMIRKAAADALGKPGNAEAVEPLIAELQKPGTSEFRYTAVRALGKLGDKQATATLCNILKDPDEEVRRAAVFALEDIKDEQAIMPLIAALRDPTLKLFVVEVLGEMGDERALRALEPLWSPQTNEGLR